MGLPQTRQTDQGEQILRVWSLWVVSASFGLKGGFYSLGPWPWMAKAEQYHLPGCLGLRQKL